MRGSPPVETPRHRHRRRRGGTRMPVTRPSAAQLRAARGRRVPDVVARRLAVLFVGTNPSLYSAAVGHHFARPGNRFWPVLYRAGFVARPLTPEEERTLLRHGYGITNLVNRATARADELTPAQLAAGARRLAAKVRRLRPRIVAILGVDAYRKGFGEPHARVGPQPRALGEAELWVLPNPSGLNAAYSLAALTHWFRRLREAAEKGRGVLPHLCRGRFGAQASGRTPGRRFSTNR